MMTDSDDNANRLLEVLRRLGRSFADNYVLGVTMQYRYLIDRPPQRDCGAGGEHEA